MPRFMFGNLQGLSREVVSKRFALVAQLLVENKVDVAFLCEVMLSSKQLKEAPLPVRPLRFTQLRPETVHRFDEKLARVLAQNAALRSLCFEYRASYPAEHYAENPEGKQKGYGILSTRPIETELAENVFKRVSTRAPLLWVAPDGTYVYVLHAISDHAAARKQLCGTLIPHLRERHPDEPWMIVGDLNCPPSTLLGRVVDLSRGPQVLPLTGTPDVFVCIPEGSTRPKSDNLLDYVISNMPCRVVRLPQESKHRSDQQAIDVLTEAQIDHRSILVEYPDLNRGTRPSSHASPSPAPAPGFIARARLPVGFQRRMILGDGNCLFRAIGFFTGHSHEALRAIAVNHVLEHWDDYAAFVTHREYAADLAVNGVWAGHIALVAVARDLDIRIDVHRSDGTRVLINEDAGQGPINLYYTGDHYDALVEQRPGLARRMGGLFRYNLAMGTSSRAAAQAARARVAREAHLSSLRSRDTK